MALTPDDIVNHEFKQALRGYAITEVDDLLDRLADQIERADRDVADLTARLKDADARLTEALATEGSLKRTLITAQDAAQRTMDDAQAHADDVLEEARTRSDAMLRDAERASERTRAANVAEERAVTARIEGLAVLEERYRAELRSQLEQYLAALDDAELSAPAGGPEVAAIRAAAEVSGEAPSGDPGVDDEDDEQDDEHDEDDAATAAVPDEAT